MICTVEIKIMVYRKKMIRKIYLHTCISTIVNAVMLLECLHVKKN